MKRAVAVVLSVATIMMIICSVCLAKEFPDVESSHWAYKYIDELSDQNIINGYEDGTYQPGGTVKRSEFLKLTIAACMPKGIDPEELMTPFDHWAAPYVWYAEERGVIKSGEYTKENIDEPITRLEMARLISNADILVKSTPSETKTPKTEFSDIMSLSDEDYDLLCHAVNRGLIKGYEDYTFKPDQTMTRAEAATMIWRFNGGKEVSE